MEKVINIAGKDVTLKSTGSLPLRYKAAFNSDYFVDIAKLSKSYKGKKSNEITSSFDSEIFYRMIWCMAKTANSSIPPLLDWVDSFEDGFPFMDILPEVQDLLAASVAATTSGRKN
jgi:hypothetical protein